MRCIRGVIALSQSNESNQDGEIIIKGDQQVKITTENIPNPSGSVLIFKGTLVDQ